MAAKILLADSNLSARNMGQKILAAAGYDVITVNNGVDAIKKIADVHPDIVLLDVYMAGYSGIEICQMVKVTSGMTQLRILLTAGRLDPFRAAEAKQLRADGVIIKPFEVSNLITIVGKLAEHLCPSQPAPPARPAVQDAVRSADRAGMSNTIQFRASREAGAAASPGPDRQTSESLATAVVRSLTTAEPPRAVQLPAFSCSQDRQVCDVCGHINPGDLFVCQQCDVPLPSSVIALHCRPEVIH